MTAPARLQNGKSHRYRQIAADSYSTRFTLGQYRNQPVQTHLEVLLRFMHALRTVHQHQFERHANFFKQDVRRHVGSAGVIVELAHEEMAI
jgi:hypothetical protein